jgi:RNA polymerase sigma factor (sigma-70 family)
MSSLLTYLQRMLGPSGEVSAADEQLLTRFAHGRDEAAFEGLVQRYGPLVFGVCRRLLANAHDAEDAFQATFLVLARKAASVGKGELVGHWLYGVAYRIARKARANIARRCAYEKQASAKSTVEPVYDMNPPQFGNLFDEEVARLPRKYRLPIVLCYLEGKPKGEIARQLGWPEGTVSARLTRAREMLRDWLTRKGVPLEAGMLAALLMPQALSAWRKEPCDPCFCNERGCRWPCCS